MTLCEYAIYRYAGRFMTPEERAEAGLLASQADAGDREAHAKLLFLATNVAITSARRERAAEQEQRDGTGRASESV